MKKHRALWFTKDRGEGTLQLTRFTNTKLAKCSQVRVQKRDWTWEYKGRGRRRVEGKVYHEEVYKNQYREGTAASF